MNYTELMFTEVSELLGKEGTRTVTIFEDYADMDLPEVIEKMIIPCLLAMGFQEASISKYIKGVL